MANRYIKLGLGALVPISIALLLVACGGEDEKTTDTPVGAGSDQPAAVLTTVPATTPAANNAPTPVTTAKLNLNSATGADYQRVIPNFPSNMVREFLEYKPYVSIQQFRKEIGKYVSADQVTAWEKYVFVPVDPNASDNETLKQIPGVTDANVGQLTSARPYPNNDAFLQKLTTVTTADSAAAAKSLLK